jgi:hypothetical protein
MTLWRCVDSEADHIPRGRVAFRSGKRLFRTGVPAAHSKQILYLPMDLEAGVGIEPAYTALQAVQYRCKT